MKARRRKASPFLRKDWRMFSPHGIGCPFGITISIDFALPSAIRLSRIRLAYPTSVQVASVSPIPCNR